MLNHIIEFEKKLLSDREQLLKLMEQHQGENDEIVLDKLQFFQKELEHMNHQYKLLKNKFEPDASQMNTAITNAQPDTLLTQQPEAEPIKPQLETQSDWQLQPKTALQQANQIQPQQNPQVSQHTKKKSTSFEKTVGSSLMGILASGLIFISLILFATLILPNMGNAVKLFGCYLLSFALISVSLFKLHKNKENRFFLALAGCGVGALYITLLLTSIYFKYIGDITLFVLITVWVAFVCYLSKVRNRVFHIIGQLGVTISIIFGSILCSSTSDSVKFISLTIFYVIAFGALYLFHFEKEVAKNKTGNIFGCINLFILFIGSLFIVEDVYYLFLLLIVLAHLASLFLGTWEKTKMSYGVFTALYAILLAIFAVNLIEGTEICGIVTYLIALVIFFLVDFKQKTYQQGKLFAQIIMIIQAWIGLSMNEIAYDHGFVWLLILPVILTGFLRKNAVCRYMALYLTFTYFLRGIPSVEQFFTGLVVMIAFYALLWWKESEYTTAFKNCLHLLGVVFFLTAGSDLINELIDSHNTESALLFMSLAIYNIAMAKSCFGRNLKTKEPENMACYNILNLILMCVGLAQISKASVLHIPVILVTLVIFLMNSKNLLDKRQNIFTGIYVGLKFTTLLVVILHSFDAANYVISSLCILFAIASIVLGFVHEYKSLRIYGLLLSMISVFKLIMIDIHYENTLGNALSFFISGILCFAISMIYNYIDKKMMGEKELEE